ncbi:DUF4259 domain-containing protein [Celeribacter arenosi]|uniref:DUF4259 domain-containing protein n=1 Tax=Celeribacter arenosi TaxID=792649 RepID=A0ABP7JUK6_9RHOB
MQNEDVHLGIWAAGSFGNDTALDFVDGLSDFKDIRSAITDAASRAGELDTDESCMLLAACDLLAASIGRPSADLPDVPGFKEEGVPDAILDSAKSLVARVRETSELAELWAEGEESEWQMVLDDLILRLTPSIPYKSPERQESPELPDDFLGYCYVCYGEVTARNGIYFEHTEDGAGTCAIHPHRKCIEDQIPGPHWNFDGSPTVQTQKKLLQDMGVEVES